MRKLTDRASVHFGSQRARAWALRGLSVLALACCLPVIASAYTIVMRGGRHIRFAKPTPMANLHLTLLDKVGVRIDSLPITAEKVLHALKG